MPNITSLSTTSALIAVGNKIPSVSDLVKKLMELKRKLLIIFMINILLLKNLISLQQECLL